jgi:hypothetical protein
MSRTNLSDSFCDTYGTDQDWCASSIRSSASRQSNARLVAAWVENLAVSTRGVTKGLIKYLSKEGWEHYPIDDVIEQYELAIRTHYNHDVATGPKGIYSLTIAQRIDYA